MYHFKQKKLNFSLKLLTPLILAMAWLSLLGIIGCQPINPIVSDELAGDDMAAADDDSFHPVHFPDNLGIPGFNFPESEVTIDEWVANNDQTSINRHGWGLWVGLNTLSDQTFEGRQLRVFETWYAPGDIQCVTGLLPRSKCEGVSRNPNPVGDLHQLSGTGSGATGQGEGGVNTVVGFVKYDPTASDHIVEKELFNNQVLNQLIADGETSIPNFPNTAISLKPAFTILCVSDVGPKCPASNTSAPNIDPPVKSPDGRYYQIRIWPGAGADGMYPTEPFKDGFGPTTNTGTNTRINWPDCIWIDTHNEGAAGSGEIDKGCGGSPDTGNGSRDTVAPFNVNDFINFQDSSSGLYYILSGMHVTSREITRWTWQTFWWTPTPDKPKDPSSPEIAADRPEQLKGAARNYAMAIGYSMVHPAQPITGGKNEGESIYAYNPHLEAGFGTHVLPGSVGYENQLSYTFKGTKYSEVPNNVGVETNCMSCHAQAGWPSGNDYTGNRYVDIGQPIMDNIRLDFLWSIQANAITPTLTTTSQ